MSANVIRGRHWLDDELYTMPLHSTLTVNEQTKALRVAGGWIYRFYCGEMVSTTFVPFHNEFQSSETSSRE